MRTYSYVLAIVAVLSIASCKNTNTTDTNGSADTAVLKKDNEVSPVEKDATNWDKVDGSLTVFV